MTLRGDGARLGQSSVAQQLVVDRKDFPDSNAAMDRLFELFPDKYPTLVAESNEAWTFTLGWPRHILEPIDSLLAERAQTCYGLDLSELASYVEIRQQGDIPFVFSMFHSWALLAPSLAMMRTAQPPQVVIHIDAHHDLSASLLYPVSPGVLVNEKFNSECRLADSTTVEIAIDAGFVNKASFLTAYVLATTSGSLLHVERDRSPEAFFLKPVIEPIQFGKAVDSRHALGFERTATENGWRLQETPTLPMCLLLKVGQTVWLDVDLDAFCNRFDGDSDRRHSVGSQDEMCLTMDRLESFVRNLSRVEWLGKIAAVSVAASPGFFPSEYWDPCIPVVCDGIAKLL